MLFRSHFPSSRKGRRGSERRSLLPIQKRIWILLLRSLQKRKLSWESERECQRDLSIPSLRFSTIRKISWATRLTAVTPRTALTPKPPIGSQPDPSIALASGDQPGLIASAATENSRITIPLNRRTKKRA